MGQKVAIIFYSATGNTEAMAEAVAVGAKKAGADVLLAPVSDVDPVEIGNTCHRIILGCSAWGVEVIEEAQMRPFCDKLKPFAGARFPAHPLLAYGYPDEIALKNCEELGKAVAEAEE